MELTSELAARAPFREHSGSPAGAPDWGSKTEADSRGITPRVSILRSSSYQFPISRRNKEFMVALRYK